MIRTLLLALFAFLLLGGELVEGRMPVWSLVLAIGAVVLVGRQLWAGARPR